MCDVITHTLTFQGTRNLFICCFTFIISIQLLLQIVKDVQNSSSMESGSDVIIEDVVFDTEEDPVVAARPIFVTTLNTHVDLHTVERRLSGLQLQDVPNALCATPRPLFDCPFSSPLSLRKNLRRTVVTCEQKIGRHLQRFLLIFDMCKG